MNKTVLFYIVSAILICLLFLGSNIFIEKNKHKQISIPREYPKDYNSNTKPVDNNYNKNNHLETYYNNDVKQDDQFSNDSTKLRKKKTLSPQMKKMSDKSQRMYQLTGNNYKLSFSYVYLNGNPHGTIAEVFYHDFYEQYSVSFYNSLGEIIRFQITDSNFSDTWTFNYAGGRYELENYKKGSRF
jgi:hypothetical protein